MRTVAGVVHLEHALRALVDVGHVGIDPIDVAFDVGHAVVHVGYGGVDLVDRVVGVLLGLGDRAIQLPQVHCVGGQFAVGDVADGAGFAGGCIADRYRADGVVLRVGVL